MPTVLLGGCSATWLQRHVAVSHVAWVLEALSWDSRCGAAAAAAACVVVYMLLTCMLGVGRLVPFAVCLVVVVVPVGLLCCGAAPLEAQWVDEQLQLLVTVVVQG